MNPHTEQIDQYAQDWKETDKPWKRWQFDTSDGDGWREFVHHPAWKPDVKYRRKPVPQFIMVNGVKVPAPYKGELFPNTSYFVPHPSDIDTPRLMWTDPTPRLTDIQALGLVHTTEEAAIVHAEAMRIQQPYTPPTHQ